MRFFYTIFIRVYFLIIWIASHFNSKAKLFTEGRKNASKSYPVLEQTEIFWFHCASLGEFEQARPIIEKIKSSNTDIGIVLTFFSPSGYEVRKNYEFADYVGYLPPDVNKHLHDFVNHFRPSKVFFVKYEFWYNLIHVLRTKQIPFYLICGIFRKDQYFFKSWGKWFLRHLSLFNHMFVQQKESAILLDSYGINNHSVAGDTRFDRVYGIAKEARKIPEIEAFVADRKTFIIGSNWPEDDKLLMPWLTTLDESYCVIVAPHNLSENTFTSIEALCPLSTERYSAFNQHGADKTRVLIIDNMGMLSSIYQYGEFAYIGGGFGANVHNVLEAATWGLPTVFGPNNQKFHEIQELKKMNAAFEISNQKELQEILNQLISDNSFRKEASVKAKDYVASHKGATELVLSKVLMN